MLLHVLFQDAGWELATVIILDHGLGKLSIISNHKAAEHWGENPFGALVLSGFGSPFDLVVILRHILLRQG